MNADPLLAPLNEQQRKVVTTTHGPVLVLAGAGSGKTRALTHRIAYLIRERMAAPSQILAVTFTNKAAKEMRERVGHLLADGGLAIPQALSTFHSLGVQILREQWQYHDRTRFFLIVDSKDSEKLVREAMGRHAISPKMWSAPLLRSLISRAKNEQKTPEAAAASMRDAALAAALKSVYTTYQGLLKKNNAFDFDDLLLVSHGILQAQEAARRMYQQRWKFISIDEYQDTNPLQDAIIQLLLGPDKHLCVVGDDYQAIYSWRGAKVDHILHFEALYPNCATIYLTQNYRSTPAIIASANAVIAANVNQKHKELWTAGSGQEPVSVTCLRSERQEASWVRTAIARHVEEGGSLKDCAVLYRTNAQSRIFEEEFLTHRVPYTIVGGFRFYDRREVKDAIAFLQFWVNPGSRLALTRIAEAFLSGVGPKTLDRWEQLADAQNTSLEHVVMGEAVKKRSLFALGKAYAQARGAHHATVADLLRMLLTTSGYLQALKKEIDGEERGENIEELYSVASAYEDVGTFLADVALLSDLETPSGHSDDRVTCMTLHAAKGLEFGVVFLVGCEEGFLPHSQSTGEMAKLEEERRLFYVGITRAKRRLYLSHASTRFLYGESSPRMPSQFLAQLPEDVIKEEYGLTATTGDDPFYVEPTITISPAVETVSARRSGQDIMHPVFGKGIIIQATGDRLTCIFEGHGVQSLNISTVQ